MKKIYAYYKEEDDQAVLKDVLTNLYPNISYEKIDITAKDEEIKNNWVKNELLNKSDANIVVRMPNP